MNDFVIRGISYACKEPKLEIFNIVFTLQLKHISHFQLRVG